MICNFTFHLIYIYINIFFSFGLVGILCWEIHTTTKGLPSLKRKGIHITCVVFSPLQLYPKSSRLSIQHLLIFLFSFSMFNLYSRLLFCWICVIFDYPWYFPRQVKKMLHNIRQYQVPLQKYMAMMDLQVPFWQFFLMLISSSQNLRNFLI